jgi:hypothetical protein
MVDGDIFQNIADYIRLGKDASDLLRQRSRRHFAASLLRSRYLPSHTPPSVPATPTKPITAVSADCVMPRRLNGDTSQSVYCGKSTFLLRPELSQVFKAHLISYVLSNKLPSGFVQFFSPIYGSDCLGALRARNGEVIRLVSQLL